MKAGPIKYTGCHCGTCAEAIERAANIMMQNETDCPQWHVMLSAAYTLMAKSAFASDLIAKGMPTMLALRAYDVILEAIDRDSQDGPMFDLTTQAIAHAMGGDVKDLEKVTVHKADGTTQERKIT